MCELIKKNMKRYKLDLKYYFDQKNPLYVQKLKEIGKEKQSLLDGVAKKRHKKQQKNGSSGMSDHKKTQKTAKN